MKKLVLLFIVVFIALSSCKKVYKPKGLTLVSNETLLEWVQNPPFPDFENTVYKDANGDFIPVETVSNLANPRDYRRDYYVNNKNEIVVVVLSKASEADKAFFDQMNRIAK